MLKLVVNTHQLIVILSQLFFRLAMLYSSFGMAKFLNNWNSFETNLKYVFPGMEDTFYVFNMKRQHFKNMFEHIRNFELILLISNINRTINGMIFLHGIAPFALLAMGTYSTKFYGHYWSGLFHSFVASTTIVFTFCIFHAFTICSIWTIQIALEKVKKIKKKYFFYQKILKNFLIFL